ncbi:hypothetical protein B0H34DRAFT_801654 [Crassisporium funariophilum]|nr:hypothetical protein B0H34DRAFT_801654 [Crassisporium funariophilum]
MSTGSIPHPAAGNVTGALPTTTQAPATGSGASNDSSDMPVQRHAGQVGYGPNYHAGPTLEDKIMGLKEELEGKITRNPERVHHGHDILSGEDRRKKLTGADEKNPFENAKEDNSKDKGINQAKPPSGTTDQGAPTAPAAKQNSDKALKEQAATVAPQGTRDAQVQRQGGAVDQMKNIDERPRQT